MLVLSGQQSRARRRAHWTIGVKIREFHPFGGHRIEVGRSVVLVAIATNVTITKIVGHNQYEVRFPFILGLTGENVGAG